jgi:hypothetical protein
MLAAAAAERVVNKSRRDCMICMRVSFKVRRRCLIESLPRAA